MIAEQKKGNLFQRHDNDTGSPEYQIGQLTQEIDMLQQHRGKHNKDFDAKRSLLKKVARRRKFLKFLKETNIDVYTKVAEQLGLKV